jgi:hypothetical protein
MKTYFRRLSLFVVALLAFAGTVMAPQAHADSRDEAYMGAAAQAVEALWSFIDGSGKLSDDDFFVQFANQASIAKHNIDDAYNGLLATQEKDADSLQAIYTLQGDVRTMGDQVDRWRQTAVQKDMDAFETVNTQLGDTVDNYDHDIDAYNAAEHGKRTITGIAFFAGIPALAFALATFMFANALFKDEKTGEVSEELLRRLRWWMAYASLAILIATGIPAGLYFFAAWEPSVWLWLLTLPGIAAYLFALYLYIKTKLLIHRHLK